MTTRARPESDRSRRVHIVIADEGWILEQYAREIERRLDYVTVGREADSAAGANYYMNYSAFRRRCSDLEMGFFTHVEERAPEAARRFFDVARSVDVRICMSDRYAEALRKEGLSNVHVIVPGVDLDRFRPIVRIGVAGRTYHTGRKGEDLVRQVLDEPGVEWHFAGEGWPGTAEHYTYGDMPRFYNSIDYLLVPAYYEGGPMPVLEALACGKQVIAPPIGFVEDYPHIEYATGDADDLRRVLRQLVAERAALRESVAHRSWEAWAAEHDRLFRELLPVRRSVSHRRGDRLRVLMATHRPENVAGGGPTVRLGRTRQQLERLGVSVDITGNDLPDARGYDLVHVFNVWEPGSALAQLRHLRRFDVPIVFSPIYMDLCETAWASRAIPAVFHQASSPEELKRYLDGVANGSLLVEDVARSDRVEIVPGYFGKLREMVGLADHLIGLSNLEMERLWAAGVEPRPFTLVRNAADSDRFSRASGELFATRFGVRDYVLCVGRLEVRKNQLMLIQALRDVGIPVVLLGHTADPVYLDLIRRHAGPNVHLVDRVPHNDELLASAYAGARVFALPSWSEGAPLTALEAAAAGVPLVLSDRSSEREYFGDLARYCDPASVDSIREAVLQAYEHDAADESRRPALQQLVRESYSWEAAARSTLEAYGQAIAQFRSRASGRGPAIRRLEIGSGTNPQPGYEHLDVRPNLPHLEHVHDVTRALPFKDSTFDEILSRSCLEHISWRKITDILRDWRRVLKPGGVLKIWMPDLEYLARSYLSGKMDEHLDRSYVPVAEGLLGGYTPAVWAAIKMFGGQDYPDNFHSALYDFPTFRRILEKAGYERIERVPPYHGLNVVAYRPADRTTSTVAPAGSTQSCEAIARESQPVPASRAPLPLPAQSPAPLAQETGPSSTEPTRDGRGRGQPGVRWGGPVFDFSGYARLSRDTILALHRRIPVSVHSFTRDDRFLDQLRADREGRQAWQHVGEREVDRGICICFHPPTTWDGVDIFGLFREENPGFDAYVGLTMFETDGLPSGWAASCNGMDEVWVPSRFNRESFARSGVDPNRLRVIPFGLAVGAYDPSRAVPMDIQGRRGFNFLSVFQWNRRKGWDVLLKAYLSAFAPGDDVSLTLRTYPDRVKEPPIGERIDRYVRQLGYDPDRIPPILLVEEFVPDAQMPSLYSAADAFVLPTRGEGWGIPFMEAMAMGLPTIGTRWSSHLDFMNDDNSYLIDVEGLVPVDAEQTQENPFYTPDQRWAQPSVEHTAALMRRLYERREEARAVGRRAREDILANWTMERTADWIAHSFARLSDGGRTGGSRRSFPARGPAETPKSVDVVWHGAIFDPSGYADEARNFILALQARDVRVAARAIGRHSDTFRAHLDPHIRDRLDRALATRVDPGFISVIHFPAYAFQRVSDAAYHVGRVMFETDGLPAEWVARCNQMDEIWVPTDFNIQSFRAAGVTVPLFKVPGGVDADRFRPGLEPLPIPGLRGVVFLSIFEWIYRKGWDVLLRAWAKAFGPGDEVTLLLRSYPPNATDGAGVQAEIERRIDRFLGEQLGLRRDQVAPIVVLGEQVPEGDMPRLFATARAYVAPSRGEGWGRPQMEAMACGLPVIATRWSGSLEFMNDQNSLLLDLERLVHIDDRAEFPSYRGQRWAEPSADHLVELLRRVVERPEDAAALGRRARLDVEQRWSWDAAAAVAAERLSSIAAGLGRHRAASAPEPLAVRWEGSQFVHHSLALVNREICLGLVEKGHELSIVPYERDQFGPEADARFRQIALRVRAPLSRPADVHVRHRWPPDFSPPLEGRWVMIQPWEFGSLPTEWIEKMREVVDEVWVPTSFVRECYVRSGMPADRVQVVPNGVDTESFRPDAPPMNLATAKGFKFLFVGGTIARKGVDALLEAYVRTFTPRDDVCLVIKDMGGDSFYKGQTAANWIRQIQADPDAPEILYLTQDMAPAELPGLYTACDCLVHPYRGEGFGLPIAEAMASGLPVVVTGAGACLDFCDEQVAYLVPADRHSLPERRIGQWETADVPFWYEPDRQALARLMRHVYEHRDEARVVGARARQRIVERFTWRHATARAVERMEALRGRPIVRLQQPQPRPLTAVLLAADAPPDGVPASLLENTDRPLAITVAAAGAARGDRRNGVARLPEGWSLHHSELSAVELLNRALEAPGDDPVLLISSDVVVTPGWLARLSDALSLHPEAALVGPVSNHAPRPQRVPARYQGTGKELRRFATRLARDRRGRAAEVPYLGGFCLLFDRRSHRTVGPLRQDLDLPLALWDYCGRIRRSGQKLLLALDSYVHHGHLGPEEGGGFDELAAAEQAVEQAMAPGHEALERGDLEAAVAEFHLVVERHPDLAAGHAALGSTLLALDRIDESVQSLRRAADLAPGDAAVCNQLGIALYRQGDQRAAEDAFQRARELDPGGVQPLLNLADMYRAQERYLEASESVKRALQLDPNDPDVLATFGAVGIELGNQAAANAALQRLEAIDPGHPAVAALAQALGEFREDRDETRQRPTRETA